MYDFPNTPALGQKSGRYTWDVASGCWDKTPLGLPPSLEPPNDTVEYVMLNSVWVPKRETKTTLPADFAVPTYAKGLRFRVTQNVVTTGTVVQMCMHLSTDYGTTYKNGASDYCYAGPSHWTGTAAYTGYPFSQTSVLPIALGTNHLSVPTWGQGIFWTKKTTGEFHGITTGHGYIDPATTNGWGRYHLRIWGANATFNAVSVVTNVRFFSSGAGVSTNHFVAVDWIY